MPAKKKSGFSTAALLITFEFRVEGFSLRIPGSPWMQHTADAAQSRATSSNAAVDPWQKANFSAVDQEASSALEEALDKRLCFVRLHHHAENTELAENTLSFPSTTWLV